MHWLLLSTIGYVCLALVFILDKLILTKSVEKPVVYTFYSTIFLAVVLLALPFGGELLHTPFDWGVATVSGLGFGFGLWAMFLALHHGETSHISPFIGAMVTVSTFVLSALWLGETLTDVQKIGVAILVFASLLLSFEKSKQHSGFHVGFLWAILAGVCFGISHVAAKYIYELYPFLTGFIWTRATIALVGVITLFVPTVWKSLFGKKTAVNKKVRVKNQKTFGHRHALSIVLSNKVLGVVGVVLIQAAISSGSVTLVNALSGMQYVLMFVLVFISSKISPQIFQEYFTKREIVVQTIAILLVCLGSVCFVL
jgi:drug/metabolite transporter (DMT)-like permease